MFGLVNDALDIMQANLDTEHYDNVTKDTAVELEKKINAHRNLLRKENVADMESNLITTLTVLWFTTIFSLRWKELVIISSTFLNQSLEKYKN